MLGNHTARTLSFPSCNNFEQMCNPACGRRVSVLCKTDRAGGRQRVRAAVPQAPPREIRVRTGAAA